MLLIIKQIHILIWLLFFIVTDKSSSQQRASIKKLTSNDLKLLSSTDFNLGELYKLKALSKVIPHVEEHTYNNLNFMDSDLTCSGTIVHPVIDLKSQINDVEQQQFSKETDKIEEFVENEELIERYLFYIIKNFKISVYNIFYINRNDSFKIMLSCTNFYSKRVQFLFFIAIFIFF